MSEPRGELIAPDVEILKTQVGSGSFATVWLGRRVSNQKPLAIKAVNRAKLNKKITDALESEIRILKAVQHLHIVTLEDIIVRDFLAFLI